MKSSNDKELFEHFRQCQYYVPHCRKDQADQALGLPAASTTSGGTSCTCAKAS